MDAASVKVTLPLTDHKGNPDSEHHDISSFILPCAPWPEGRGDGWCRQGKKTAQGGESERSPWVKGVYHSNCFSVLLLLLRQQVLFLQLA